MKIKANKFVIIFFLFNLWFKKKYYELVTKNFYEENKEGKHCKSGVLQCT